MKSLKNMASLQQNEIPGWAFLMLKGLIVWKENLSINIKIQYLSYSYDKA